MFVQQVSCSTHILLHVFGLHSLVGGIGWVQGAKDEPREAGMVRLLGPSPSQLCISPWGGGRC